MTRSLPPNASVAETGESAKLHAPSAARNAGDIATFVAHHAPASGKALEIASGTGQHVIAFAARMPDLIWQPTDVAAERLRSIDAYATEAGLRNLRSARLLDALTGGWAAEHADQDLIVLINLLHLISAPEAQTALREIGHALAPDGTFILYGPFKRNGALTSDGDARFDADLRRADPAIGYKDTREIAAWLDDVGLSHISYEMPANNLAFVCRKPPV